MLVGFGVGGEFVGAATLVAGEMPENRRLQGAGFLNSGYYVGTFIAAALNYTIGAHYGWRAMFMIGGVPALFVAWIRYGVHEPEKWKNRMKSAGVVSAKQSFLALFTPEYRTRTIINCTLALVSMIGLWAGTVYAPGAVTQVAMRDGYSPKDAAQIASWATMLLSTGTVIACLSMHLLAERLGRRGAVAFFFSLMAVSISVGFGWAFYLPHGALGIFITCLFFVGIGGGSFPVYLAWLPEQYRTECRGSAIALAFGIGRFVAAGATFLVGMGVAAYGSLGVPVALTSIAFVLGLFLVRFAVETKGQPLPE